MSLHVLANHMASKGRDGDSMLVHMTPGEVHGLQALAMKHGGSLTVNPDTGLPEANFLKSLLPILAGVALGPAGFGLVSSAMGAGAIVGGITGLATGSLSKGLMAGLSAYGGFGIGESLMGAGADAMTRTALSAEGALPSVENIAQVTGEGYGGSAANYSDQVNTAVKAARDTSAAMPKADLLSAGAKSAMADPLGFAKQNWKPIAAAALPILSDIGTTTPIQAPTMSPGRIREKRWDGRQFVDVASTDAGVYNTSGRSFSDLYRGYNDGGIVALAGGGMPRFAGANGSLTNSNAYEDRSGPPAMLTDEQLYQQTGSWEAAATARDAQNNALNAFNNQQNDTPQTTATELPADAIARIGREQAERARIANDNLAALQPAKTVNTTGTTAGAGITGLKPVDLVTGTSGELSATPNNAATTAATTTGGGLATLANATGATTTGATGAGTTTTGGGLATLASTTGATTTGRPTAEQAAATVATIYRNVLGRDPDPNGMAYWTQQLTSGNQDSATMYADFIKGAQANKETGNFGLSLTDAQKGYAGYSSADASNIADEWVRNVLGREVTDADRKTQWYKDAVNKEVMNTYAKAENIYNNFRDYAALQTGSPAANLDLYQASKLMGPQAKVTTVTGGGGTDIVVPSGYHLENGVIVKNIDATQRTSTVVDTPTNINTAASTALPVGVSGNTGPSQIGGGATVNPNRTITTSPRIPGIPVGGFTGMTDVRDAYTKGGGKLGYTSPVPASLEAFNKTYVTDRMSGDSLAAYEYLSGKKGAKYPVKSGVGQISEDYATAVLGYPARGNLPYTYNKATGKMDVNPDYVAPGRDAAGNVTYSMSLNDIKSSLKDTPLSGQALYDWAVSNNLSAQQIADATGRSLSSVYSDFRAGSKAAAKKKEDDKAAGITSLVDQSSTGGSDSGGGPGGTGPGGVGGAGGPASTTASESIGPAADSGNDGDDGDARGGYYSRGKLNYRARNMAMGGATGYALGGLGTLGGYSDGGRLLRGPGDGVSDSIPATIGRKQQPARLADGEFVVPARIVSELGNGSTDAGAKKLYAMMDRVQRARGKTTGKNKVAANSRADKYLPA